MPQTAAAYLVAAAPGIGPVAFHHIAAVNAAAGRDFAQFLRLSRPVRRRDYNLSPRRLDALEAAVLARAATRRPWGAAVESAIAATLGELASLERDGARLILAGARGDPARLRDALGDRAPSFLFCRGDVGLLERAAAGQAIAVVGTRRPSPWGAECAAAISRAVARADRIVVSGYAHGVDRTAHCAAIEAGGQTLLVLSYGVGLLEYDAGSPLAAAERDGRAAVISQFPPGERFTAGTAMARNRVVAALAGRVVAVETGERGGTMRTARMALDLARPLFAVRAETLEATPPGNRRLLAEGARPLWASRRAGGGPVDVDCAPLFAPAPPPEAGQTQLLFGD